MAIIYTYPTKATLATSDLILISDSADGNKTKNATVTSIKDAIDVVDSITATSPLVASASTGAVTLSIPAATSGVDGYLARADWSTFNSKQVELQSGVNIKTINSNSILGSGNLVISGGAANPAGADTQVQFNSSGSFGASPNLSFTTDILTLTDTLEIKGDGVNPGTLKLYCENVSTPHAVSILGPVHSGATPYSIRLPKEIATQTAYSSGGRVLESDASGALQWIATPAGGSGGPGTGTQYSLPIWSTTSTLGDSLVTQNSGATVVNIGTSIASFSTVAGTGSVFATRLAINGYTTSGGKLELKSPDGATHAIIEGPANGGTAYSLKTPSALGTTGQVLTLTTAPNNVGSLAFGNLGVSAGGTGVTTIGQYSVFVGTSNTAVERSSSATGAIQLPSGTTAQRPSSPVNGMIRHSTTSGTIEAYIEGSWVNLYTP